MNTGVAPAGATVGRMEVKEVCASYMVEAGLRVAKGYKQTQVGVIPEDWDYQTFGHIYAEPSRNGIYKTPAFHGRGIRIVNMGEMFGFEFISDQHMSRVALTARELSTNGLHDGDLLFGRRSVVPSGAGKCSLVMSPAEPITFESSIIRVRLDRTEAVPRFYYYFFASPTGRATVATIVSGTNVKGIRATELRELKVPLPSKAEQAAIAEALSDADALIESLEQLLAKKRQIKQGAMQELLTGKKRLPGFSGEWEERTLFELAGGRKELFDDGDWIESEHITDDGIRLIQTGNIGVGSFVEKGERKYIFESSFASLRCKEIRQGDLLICRLADPAGRACVLPDIGEAKIVTSVDVTIFRPPKSAADRVFLANLFSTERWFSAVSDRSGGTTHKRIARGALGRITINIPSIEEQTAIATVLSDMDTELAALEAKLAKVRNLKQGMMQELLTGRIRLI